MGNAILVMGESGRGKSRSLINLKSEETVLNRVLKKPLPFEGWKNKFKPFNKDDKTGNMFDIRDAQKVIKLMKYVDVEMPEKKVLVVDDAGMIMALELFDKATETGFQKFTIAAKNIKEVLMAPEGLRDDLTVIFMFHVETSSFNGFDRLKAKTAGKMIDAQLGVESLFTYVLLAEKLKKGKDDIDHVFSTMSDGSDTVKMPEEMFDDKYIPNDLNYVLEKIKEYNEGG